MSKHKGNIPCENLIRDNLNQVEVQEVPLFNFEMLAGATNNFHESNKLGQGGFGPVYRVMVALEVYYLIIYLSMSIMIRVLFIGKIVRWTRNCSKKTF